jgi:hypothetical protein
MNTYTIIITNIGIYLLLVNGIFTNPNRDTEYLVELATESEYRIIKHRPNPILFGIRYYSVPKPE